MKKKILFINFEMPVGGIERSLLGLLNTIDYNVYEVDLFLYQHRGDFIDQLPKHVNLLPEHNRYKNYCGGIMDNIKRGDILLATIRLVAKFSTHLINKYKNINGASNSYCVRYYRWSIPFFPSFENEYDAVFSYQTPHFLALNKFKAKKKIGFIHTDYSTIDVDASDELPMWDALDSIVAISEETRTAFLKLFPSLSNKTVVVENILSSEFVRTQANLLDVSSEMPFVEGSIKLLSVGRFCYPKAFDDAIRSAAIMRDNGVIFRWFFIGFGPDEPIMQSLIKEYKLEGVCVILGKKINPYPYMKACDIYVQPSRFEGKAVTVREAQMLCKPVLITNYPTAVSQVNDGVDGVIVPMGVESLAKELELFIQDKERQLLLSANCCNLNFSNIEELVKLEQLFN